MYLPTNTVLAGGPIIIEDGKILLVRERKYDGIESPFFMLPGGGYEITDESLEATCHREAREELGIEIEIVRPLRTLIVKRPDKDGFAVLAHFLANRKSEIIPGPQTVEWGWYDVNNLPENTAPSIRQILESYFNEPHV